MVGNPSVIEGQTADILNWSMGLSSHQKYLMGLLAERKFCVVPAMKYFFFLNMACSCEFVRVFVLFCFFFGMLLFLVWPCNIYGGLK